MFAEDLFQFGEGSSKPKLPDNILHFKSYINCMKVPFVIYLDFESFIVKDGDQELHHPSGFSCLTVSSFKEFNNEKPFYIQRSRCNGKVFPTL